MSIWYHTNDQPPYPEKQKLRYGSHAYESPSRSAQSDSFRAYRAEYAKWSYFPALPACWTYATLRRHKRQPKYRSEIHRAVYSEKAAYILCYNMESPKRNFHPSSAQPHHNIPIFANMVAWNARTMPSFAPATLCLVDTPKSRFVLEHQAYSFCLILDCQKPYGIANFLRLQSPRRPPFWDALRAASPCASRAFLASCKYNCYQFLFLFYASKACFISFTSTIFPAEAISSKRESNAFSSSIVRFR